MRIHAPVLTRQAITSALVAALQPLESVRAATLGGSDAWEGGRRADELSDIDIVVFVAPGHIETTAEAIDRSLRALSPVSAHIRLPMPTWHGFHQAFYQLERAPEHLMIDWLIIETSSPHPWFEVERHGTPRVLFDKDALVKTAHVDRAAINTAIAKRVEEIRQRSRMFRHLPVKLAHPRNLPVDAAYFYHQLVLRPLVDMLRITPTRPTATTTGSATSKTISRTATTKPSAASATPAAPPTSPPSPPKPPA